MNSKTMKLSELLVGLASTDSEEIIVKIHVALTCPQRHAFILEMKKLSERPVISNNGTALIHE